MRMLSRRRLWEDLNFMSSVLMFSVGGDETQGSKMNWIESQTILEYLCIGISRQKKRTLRSERFSLVQNPVRN